MLGFSEILLLEAISDIARRLSLVPYCSPEAFSRSRIWEQKFEWKD